jgi:hypothetical protein
VGAALLPSHRRARADRLACRTATLGGPLDQGDAWGRAPDVYPACRHRRCPQCHDHDPEAWRAERRPELRPGSSCPVVLTGPHARRARVRRHPQDRYASWLRAAAHARITRAAAQHDGGGLMGGLGVLHTGTRALLSHPPGPCRVPAGGLSRDRTQWQPARPPDLVAVRALSTRCRGLFRALVRQACPALSLPAAVWPTAWGVEGNPTVHGTEPVRRSWGRDVSRIAVPNTRLLSSDAGPGRFRAQDSQLHRGHTMALPAQALIRRVLQPVWPPGCHQVRDEGRWRPAHRALLPRVQRGLAGSAPTPSPAAPAPATGPDDSGPAPLRAGQPCPHCGRGLLVLMRPMPRLPREPP